MATGDRSFKNFLTARIHAIVVQEKAKILSPVLKDTAEFPLHRAHWLKSQSEARLLSIERDHHGQKEETYNLTIKTFGLGNHRHRHSLLERRLDMLRAISCSPKEKLFQRGYTSHPDPVSTQDSLNAFGLFTS